MSKNLEELKKIEDKIFKTAITKFDVKALTYMMERIVHCIILILENFEKRLGKLEREEEGSGPRIRLIKELPMKKGGLNKMPATPRPWRRPRGRQAIKSDRMNHLEVGAKIGKSREKPKTKGGRSGRYIRK